MTSAISALPPGFAADEFRPARSMARRWATRCCLTILLALPVAGAASELFPDPALEAAVRTQVFAKRGTEAPLVEADVVNISTVEAKGRGITNLAGLEKCRSLAMLDLAGNKVSDLSPLSGLQRLQFLDVQSNRVENLKPLAGVTALQYLHLAQNKVEDLSALAGLTNLSALYLTGNKVEDIRPLLDLRRLSSLYLDRNRIRDISGIGQIRGLSSLSLAYNRVQDLRSLHGLNRLQHLFLEHNRIRDLAPVVTWVKADAEQRFAPFLNLYLADNPLSSTARKEQLKEVESAGVRVRWGDESAKKSAPAH
ncbi:MAG: leucine-rich repeat domain-containing protein [Verrucomicrobiales bacterium]|nr:leucine-rich repeat domain-containing protein [Verrucomicrobiales bacterium]